MLIFHKRQATSEIEVKIWMRVAFFVPVGNWDEPAGYFLGNDGRGQDIDVIAYGYLRFTVSDFVFFQD